MELGTVRVYFVQANEYPDNERTWWTLGGGAFSNLEGALERQSRFEQQFSHHRTRIVLQETTNRVVD